jgi:carbon-monoxide dehydrogenase large subunit
VRWVGEPVVAIVAESEAQGRDAAELVEVDYEEIEAVTDIEAGSQPRTRSSSASARSASSRCRWRGAPSSPNRTS